MTMLMRMRFKLDLDVRGDRKWVRQQLAVGGALHAGVVRADADADGVLGASQPQLCGVFDGSGRLKVLETILLSHDVIS